MKRTVSILLSFILILTMINITYASTYENSVDLYRLATNDANGLSTYNNQTVTVKGVVSVASGVWHDTLDYFAICTEDGNYRFSGATIVHAPKGTTSYAIGDEVIVKGKVVNNAYTTDTGTTTIKVSSANDIKKIGTNKKIPDAFPIFSNPTYEEVEYELDYQFEGKLVRVVGIVHNLSTAGTVKSFYVDGSRDGNYTDGIGSIQIKSYSYSGIDISNIKNGDWVIAEGILMQGDSTAPYTSGYYIRPTKSSDISLLTGQSELFINEANRTDNTGKAVFSGKTITVKGVSTVTKGEWHDTNSAYTIVNTLNAPGYPITVPASGIYVYDDVSKTSVNKGDLLSVTGVIGNEGYDKGMVVIKPSNVTNLQPNTQIIQTQYIHSDMTYQDLKPFEAMPVKIQGKVISIKNTGITRNIVVDGSKDGNWTDGIGTIPVKFYSYSSTNIDNIIVGETVTVTGILQKYNALEPYTGEYFIRPTDSLSVVKRNQNTKRTLYIHLDAFRGDYVNRPDWNTPTFNSLIANGVECTQAYGEYVSMTTSNMITLSTGAHTSTHNVPALAFFDKENDRRVRYLQNYDVATIGEMFQKEGLLVGTVKQRKLQNRGADLFEEGGTIATTTQQAVDMVNKYDPDLMVVLYNETDSNAHKYGIYSNEMKATVEEVDAGIASILQAYQNNGSLSNLNVVIVSDHGMETVNVNLTSALDAALASTGIPYQNAYVNIGPFNDDTKVVYNLSSGAAQIYFRKPLTETEITTLTNALLSIDGVKTVFNRAQLDAMNTPQNLGDLVVDCKPGYAFSVSKAEHGASSQRHSFMIYNGVDIRQNYKLNTPVESVDAVANILKFHNITPPATVDGKVLSEIFK